MKKPPPAVEFRIGPNSPRQNEANNLKRQRRQQCI
jgi:hypothetical protein